MLSERPEHNKKVAAGFLMAPVAFTTQAPNSIFGLSEDAQGQIIKYIFRPLCTIWSGGSWHPALKNTT